MDRSPCCPLDCREDRARLCGAPTGLRLLETPPHESPTSSSPPPGCRLSRPGGLSGKLSDRVTELRDAHPGAAVQLWATDEHRIGLLPLIRKVWAPIGKRPVAPVQQRYEWLYVCGFVRPTTGQTERWLLPTVTAHLFGHMLAAFARDVAARS